MKKKQILFITIIILLLTLLAVLVITNTTTKSQNDLALIRVASLQGPTSIGMIKMIDEKQTVSNIMATYEIIKTPDLLVSKLQSNEFDIACLPVNLAAIMYNKGMEYQLLGVNTLNSLYIVGNNSDITDIRDLKGKTINVINKGATPDVLFNYIMSKNGIDIKNDITADYSMQQVELAQSIIADKVQYAVLPEPFVSQVLSKNSNCKILFDFQSEFDKVNGENTNITQGCIVVNKEFASKNKKIVEEFIKQYTNSIEFANSNLDEAGYMCEKYSLGVTASTAETAILRSNIVYISAKDSKISVDNFLKVLYDFSPDSIGGKLPDSDFYYNK